MNTLKPKREAKFPSCSSLLHTYNFWGDDVGWNTLRCTLRLSKQWQKKLLCLDASHLPDWLTMPGDLWTLAEKYLSQAHEVVLCSFKPELMFNNDYVGALGWWLDLQELHDVYHHNSVNCYSFSPADFIS